MKGGEGRRDRVKKGVNNRRTLKRKLVESRNDNGSNRTIK